jgi:hypothetical protein
MTNLAEKDAEIRQSPKTTTEERDLMSGDLYIAAQPLDDFETFRYFKQLRTFEIHALDLRSSEIGTHISDRGKWRRIVGGQHNNHLRSLTELVV